MSDLKVRFEYVPGFVNPPFENVRLAGCWTDRGEPAEGLTFVPMTARRSPDGQVVFEAEVSFPAGAAGHDFAWGVVLDTNGRSGLWGVTTEVRDHRSTDRRRWFRLESRPEGTGAQVERYDLTHCRRLGANRFYRPGAAKPCIRFATWAPNARKVELVIGTIWDARDPAAVPNRGPFPVAEIAGGYVADDGTGADERLGPFAMSHEADGVWSTDPDDPGLADFAALDHRPYMFRVTKDDGSVVYRTDLYSRCQIGSGIGTEDPKGKPFRGRITHLDGTVSCSVVVDPETVTGKYDEQEDRDGDLVSVWPEALYIPAEEFWRDEYRPDRPVPGRPEDLVIYELHIGALGFGRAGVGLIEDAIGLLDYLEELGVNAIELLPMSEFGGENHFWGYSTSHYFAIEYSGGGRDKYKFFVRECHRRGIAVIMDVVYNHYVHDADRAQWLFDTSAHDRNCYYWYEGNPFDYPEYERVANEMTAAGQPGVPSPGHGGYVDNMSTGYAPAYHEEAVRKLFISSAVALVREFHIDGFRMDQTTSIHSYNRLHADGRAMDHVNGFGVKFLRELTSTLKLIDPDVILIAEDHSGWDMVTAPVDRGGLGFDLTWHADFYHHLIGDAADKGSEYAKILKTAGSGYDGPLALGRFAEELERTGFSKLVYHESHDEAGNAGGTERTIVTASVGGPPDDFARARLLVAAGTSLFSAGTPMILFGEEVAVANPFLYSDILPHRADLKALRAGPGATVFDTMAGWIRLRREHAALKSRKIRVVHVHDANRVLAWLRWKEDSPERWLIVACWSNHGFPNGYRLEIPGINSAGWRIQSPASRFAGDGFETRVNSSGVYEDGGWLDIDLPPVSLTVLRSRRD